METKMEELDIKILGFTEIKKEITTSIQIKKWYSNTRN